MTHTHQYNTWQQMKTQGHICREPTGMNIYLYVRRFLEVSQAPPMLHAAESSRAPWLPIRKHTHPHRHSGVLGSTSIWWPSRDRNPKDIINCKSRLNQTSIVLGFRTIPLVYFFLPPIPTFLHSESSLGISFPLTWAGNPDLVSSPSHEWGAARN